MNCWYSDGGRLGFSASACLDAAAAFSVLGGFSLETLVDDLALGMAMKRRSTRERREGRNIAIKEFEGLWWFLSRFPGWDGTI